MKPFLLCYGTRPEAIKMLPLFLHMREKGMPVQALFSGQHPDMVGEITALFGVSDALSLPEPWTGGSLPEATAGALRSFGRLLAQADFRAVLVHGDTLTAFAAALAAYYRGIPVVHVEAGLRSGDLSAPFPEEWNRRAIDLLSCLDLAPTPAAKENLLREGKDAAQIHVVGNTVTDAFRYTLRGDYTHPFLERGRPFVLVTAHRRENIGAPLRAIARAVRRLAEGHRGVDFLLPMHPNPSVRALLRPELSSVSNVFLCEPLPVADFHNLMARAMFLMSDSGGVQEEASTLGVPLLILRTVTERQEGVDAGILACVGVEEDAIFAEAELLLRDTARREAMRACAYAYGDGAVSARIARILSSVFF